MLSSFFLTLINVDRISIRSIKIRYDVWIGSKVYILSGESIGDGVIIVVNSLAKKNVKPYTIFGGVSAHHFKSHFLKISLRNGGN